jgi:excisionase family DNA binding protein
MLLNVPEVARRLRVSDKTVWRLLDAGDLPYVRIGARILVRPSDLDEFVEDRLERRSKAKAA